MGAPQINIESWIFELGKKAIKPDPILTVSEWADENRILAQISSAIPGPWRTERTPYLKAIMDALSPSSPWETVGFMKGSQIGGTECGLNWIGSIIDKFPGPLLHVMPTVEIAKDQSKTRLATMIDECPALKDKVSEEKSRDGGNSMLMKLFPGGFWGMTGANSPAALRSKPIRYLFLDEVDAFPGDVGGEGDPVNLAIARTRTFSRRKIFIVSSPTISGRSRIEKVFEKSNQMRYYVPCPVCGHYQVLKWNHVKWEYGKPETAWYECENGCKIFNHEKAYMLPKGEWRSETKNYSGKSIAFHVSSLYSPPGWFSWGEMARLYVDSKDNEEMLKTFVNTCLGEVYVQAGESPEWEKLYYRRENYEIGKVPDGGLFLTAGADIQKDRIEVMVRAWGRDKENWIIDYRVFPGDTSNLKSDCWISLDSLLSEGFEHENGTILHIKMLAVDTGYNTNIVYSWCRKYPINRVMPVKGQLSQAVMVGQPKAVDVIIDGKKKSRALKLWNIGVSIIKTELYGWLRFSKPEAGEKTPPGYVHFPDMPESFFQQLCAETLVIKDVKGKKVFEWVMIYPRNEVLDCAIYSRAAACLLQIDKFTGEHWRKLEAAVGKKAVKKKEEPAPLPPSPPQVKQVPHVRRRVISKGIRL